MQKKFKKRRKYDSFKQWYPETTLDQITPMFPSFFNKKYVLEILKFAPLIVMIVML